MTNMAREDALAWSILDPRPGFYYHPRSDAHICIWQGVVMTQIHALLMIAGNWNLTYPNDRMRKSAYAEFIRAYRLGAFGDHPNWEYTMSEDPYGYITQLGRWITKRNPNLLTDLKSQYSIKEALEWFRADNEQVIDD
jgi:hypothetical protein